MKSEYSIMDSVLLATTIPDATNEVDLERCIVCQDEEPGKLTTTINGRKKIKDAAAIRNDVVTKRLTLIHDDFDFMYHMTNNCYKRYTMQKTLNKIAESSGTSTEGHEDFSLYKYRRLSTHRSKLNPKCNLINMTCVICGNVKHSGRTRKFRIS